MARVDIPNRNRGSVTLPFRSNLAIFDDWARAEPCELEEGRGVVKVRLRKDDGRRFVFEVELEGEAIYTFVFETLPPVTVDENRLVNIVVSWNPQTVIVGYLKGAKPIIWDELPRAQEQ